MKKLLLSVTALVAMSGLAAACPAPGTILRVASPRPVVAYAPAAVVEIHPDWRARIAYRRHLAWERYHHWLEHRQV